MTGLEMEMESFSDLENRYNCVVCWRPQLYIVYGMCQHRICTSCMYDEVGLRRDKMDRCPLCQQPDAFPIVRPPIPEDNTHLLRLIGIRECLRCHTSHWAWEQDTHSRSCPPKKPAACMKRKTSGTSSTLEPKFSSQDRGKLSDIHTRRQSTQNSSTKHYSLRTRKRNSSSET